MLCFLWLAEKEENKEDEEIRNLVNFLKIPRCYFIVLCTVAKCN